jgi:predicted secreted protein with PEFG-CTERM motif
MLSCIVAVSVIAWILVSPILASAQETTESLVYSPDSAPYGTSYQEWTTIWWTWFISIPTDQNPINDHTGVMCTEYQDGPVWFLLGSGGGKAERSCTVPAGKAILIPNIIIECSYAEDQSLQDVADLEMCAKEGIDVTTEIWTTIDGESLPESEIYRVKSEPFNFTFPENNVFSAPAGPTQGVSDGYWTFIRPLPPGNHTIHLGGVQVDYTVTTPTNFVEDSTYHLTIVGTPREVVNHNITIAGEQITIPINTTSSIENFVLDEEAKRVAFSISENNTVGDVMLPIGRILNGPYAVAIDGNDTAIYETVEQGGETWLRIEYDGNTDDVTIVGTSVVPEFPFAMALILASSLGAVILVGRQLRFGWLNFRI